MASAVQSVVRNNWVGSWASCLGIGCLDDAASVLIEEWVDGIVGQRTLHGIWRIV